MANKNDLNSYGDKALSDAQAKTVSQQVDKFNKILSQGKQFQTTEELRKPLIEKPYRFLDNLSPYLQVSALVPLWENPDSPITWNRFPIPSNVINIREMNIDSTGNQVELVCYDPDYVFLEELSLKINSYTQRGIGLKIEIEYGWSVPDAVKRQYPNVQFTDIIQMSNIRTDLQDVKNGLVGKLKGAADGIVIPIGKKYSPSAVFGIGSVANYFLIYDFLCLDFSDKLELIWSVKDGKQREEFINSYFEFIFILQQNPSVYAANKELIDKPYTYSQVLTPGDLSRINKVCTNAKNWKSANAELKTIAKKVEDRIKNFPQSPYSILLYMRDPKNKVKVKAFEKFFATLDIIMQNYRIHPYRIYKFLVDVFQKDVLGNDEYKKIEQTDLFDFDFIDFAKDGMGGNIQNIISKEMKKRMSGTSYLEAINAFYTGEYPKDKIGDDYKYLVKEVYKRLKNTKGTTNKEYGSYFFPVKDYSLSTNSTFEQMIPAVAAKCRKQDNVVTKGKTQQTDDSHYACQFFRASPLSAFQNLGVLELIMKSKKTDTKLLKRVQDARKKAQQILTENGTNTNNKSTIFCLFVPNKLTAILNDTNKVANNILTAYAYRNRSLKDQDYFNSGSVLFTETNFPDVISLEFEFPPSNDTAYATHITSGSDYKLVMALDADGTIKNKINTIANECDNLVNIQDKINTLLKEQLDISKNPKSKDATKITTELKVQQKLFSDILYGTDGKSGLSKVLRNGVLAAILEQNKKSKIIDNLVPNSKFKNIITNLSSENVVTKKEEDKKKEDEKSTKKVKAKAPNVAEEKYNAAVSEFGLIKEFVDEYRKQNGKGSLFPPSFNMSFADPVIFGAGSSPTTEGISANKQMENFRRIRALEASAIKATLTVVGNPALKRYYGNGAAAPIFLNIYNPDGTLSELAGQYTLSGIETKFTAGIYTNTLKLQKDQVRNELILSYIQNNDILSIC